MTFSVKNFTMTLTGTEWQGDGVGQLAFKAPTLANGGGVKIIDAYIVDQTGTTAGTAFEIELLNYGTTGTVNGGTIGSVGGTADPLTANTPKQFTLTATPDLNAGEWLFVNKKETNSSDPDQATLVVQYADGN